VAVQVTKKTTRHKPNKPYQHFPLFLHATGRWAKKIRGRMHYFGPWSDPDGALQKYLDQRDDLQAGRTPRVQGDGLRQPAGNDLHLTAVFFGKWPLCEGTSRDTSDFVADAIEWWWTNRREVYGNVRRLQIDLDNGPEIASSRTPFMKRLVDFSDRHQLTLELAYYPPYHSKYNLIERCWGILENHWNGSLLTSIDVALAGAKTMRWRGVSPIVHLLDRVYATGIHLTKAAFRPIAARLQRSATLPKWSLTIEPRAG